MTSIHLLGGGWDEQAIPRMYGGFAVDVLARGGRLGYVLQSGTPGTRFTDVFAGLGLASVRRLTISTSRGLRPRDLQGLDGIFVCGGSNPLYQRALADVAPQIKHLVMNESVPYAGFSAGAVVASQLALVGGWRRTVDDATLPVCPERRSEGLEQIETGVGLGLVPFSVDVHGTQWGTLSRAIHAIDAELITGCCLVDENTVVSIRGTRGEVKGLNSVYYVQRKAGEIVVRVHPTGSAIDFTSDSPMVVDRREAI